MADSDFQPNPAYLQQQFDRALETARTHEVPEARERALGRMEKLGKVAWGIARGTLNIGSRTPVVGMPAWVTPEVIRGGFVTGEALAATALSDDERALAARLGVEAKRSAIFAALLTPPGLEELGRLMDGAAFEIAISEHAALLVVAWLARQDRRDDAVQLVEELAPFSTALRFMPRETAPDARPAGVVHRQTVAETRRRLAESKENARIAAMREALEIWIPLADEALELWLETVVDGRVDGQRPDGWQDRAGQLVARYDRLAVDHTRVTKTHTNPKENLARLLIATREAARGALTPSTAGRLQHSVDAMLRKRGAPGSAEHRALRDLQAAIAARPGHHQVAAVAAQRLAGIDERRGIEDPEEMLGPVTAAEADRTAVPAGTAMPRKTAAIIRRGQEGTPEALLAAGVIRSAEVLATLASEITAPAVAAAYPDPALRSVMQANYLAFAKRRSVLLWDLQHQVRVDELPWVRAVAADRTAAHDSAHLALARLAGLTVAGFPATLIPSALVTELSTLAKAAGLRLPLVEELAADIFMGRFTPKFLRAAQLAGRQLDGSLYARYYGIDYAEVERMAPEPGAIRDAVPAFDALCLRRSVGRLTPGRTGIFSGRSPAENGTIIEQAQILTTQNLAALLAPAPDGLALPLDPAALADASFEQVVQLVERVHHNPRPLRTIKNAAYGWRNVVYFMTLLPVDRQLARLAALETVAAERSDQTRGRLAPALQGLRFVVEGGAFEEHEAAQPSHRGRRFTGWSVGPHWMAADPSLGA